MEAKLMLNNFKIKKISGQVALVVLVLVAVSLSLGMSVSNKVVSETKIDKDEELLKEAFNAAESGIEYYLGTGLTNYQAPNNMSSASVSVSDVGGGGSSVLDFDEYTMVNDNLSFWLVEHRSNGSLDLNNSLGNNFSGNSLTVCVNDDFNSSIAVSYFYSSGLSYAVERWVYQFGNEGGVVEDALNGVGADGGNCGPDQNGVELDLAVLGGNPLLLSVKPLFNPARISLVGSASFPSQGVSISSLGEAGQVGSTTLVDRRISVMRRWETDILSLMIDGLVAEGMVSSN